ncbi:hypothetical protein Glove_243g7 [Diversispora epigaea]|uniref:Uncharacterized protein n=1 Tax=Diversispora epigaea TaxID=1348612 RepID=A0A397IFZ5_9GLOM|nr:hypothetical protein Glove_243g7 [Diversispora epigaea]
MNTQTKTDKKLTSEYLEWHIKLTSLPKSSQIENVDNHLLRDCIKISKFPKEKNMIIEAVQKRFPFLRYIKSNAWYRDVFKYTNSEAKCPICKEKVIITIQSLPKSVPNKISNLPIHPNKTCLYQYAIKHGIDPEKFSVITEAEKNRWTMGCFRADLERDIRLYRGGIKRNENTRKYHKFLTD